MRQGAHEDKYRHNQRVTTLKDYVRLDNINQTFAAQGVPDDLDLLTIDVDGQEYWLWEALTDFSPRVLLLEYNSSLPDDEPLVEPRGRSGGWDGSDYGGASIGALRRLAASKGYRLVYQEMAGVNAFFVRDDQLASLGEIIDFPRQPNISMVPGKGHPKDPLARSYVNLDD